jgi:hypothetical protein
MIGFLGLMLLLAAVVCLGAYWISWEGQDTRTRPRFTAKLAGDCARLFRRSHEATPAPRPHSRAVLREKSRAPESSS